MSCIPPYDQSGLLYRIAEGEELAFSQFMHEHSRRLYAYILSITKSEQWAEEILQDVWLQVWQNRSLFADLESPIAYLHKMVRNRTLGWIRSNKRDLKIQYILYQHYGPQQENAVEEKINLDAIQKILDEGIALLPPQRRKILMLKQEGYSYEEIAQLLGISKNTVRNQLVSAFGSLRQHLKDHGSAGWVLFILFFPFE